MNETFQYLSQLLQQTRSCRMNSKKVCVIGAGASGLTAIKCCLENGFQVQCYEMSDDIGGLWRYTPSLVGNDRASVMKSTVINTSKEMMAYSDFPMPDTFPLFTHNTKVLDYFHMYSQHFNLTDHITFNTKVEMCERANDYDATGRWQLTIRGTSDANSRVEVYDAVLLCTGHHATPHVPTFEGLSDRFSGKVIHTHDYKTYQGYEDKNVLVIGIGNSGGDVAVELSLVAKQVYLSTRRGSWVFYRISDQGYPVDMVFARRPLRTMARVLPALTDMYANYKLNKRLNHENYGLKPHHPVLAQHPMVNDSLPNRIASGAVEIRPDVKRFTENGVEFEDGSRVENIDDVILATGYKFGFPYLEEGVIPVEQNQVELYEYVFPPHLKHPTLAVLGCVQPLGALMPISEMQCRWFCRVLAGHTSLPSVEEMKEDMRRKREFMRKRYFTSQRHTIQVDYVDYMDELASKVGCKPGFLSLLQSDPLLAFQCYLGPVTPYQYRLCGPHPWSGAKHAIDTQWERSVRGTRPRDMPYSTPIPDYKHQLLHSLLLSILAFTLLATLWLFLC